jgi:hypothetical protein
MHITNSISSFLKKWPLHSLLLPLFFILHMYVQLGGLLPLQEFILAFLKTAGVLFVVFAGGYLLYKDRARAGLVTTLGGTMFLFFSAIKDLLSKVPLLEYIASYKILLPLLLAMTVLFFFQLRKRGSFANATLFLNVLFVIYLGIEIWKFFQVSNGKKLIDSDNARLADPGIIKTAPDIYYIVMDGYPSSAYQKEILGAPYNSLDSALSLRGFYILPNSVSNYNYTIFSMASVFQMQYVDWLKDVKHATPHHISNGAIEVERSVVPSWLEKKGYQLYNLSILNLPGHPCINDEKYYFPTNPAIIFRHTFWNAMKWQVIPALFPVYIKHLEKITQKRNRKALLTYRAFNDRMLDSLSHLPSQRQDAPKFVYAHFEMPHYPYFYDSTGKPYPETEIYSSTMATNKNRLSNYIGYINTRMTRLIDSIRHYGKDRNIIILQSDHGIRDIRTPHKADVFKNYSAFYFPDNDYRLLYDSMSNVNTFRIVFNKYFGQRLPLLKDSSIYLKY